jgi:hypothetical protein
MHREYFRPPGYGYGLGRGRGIGYGHLWNSPVYYNSYMETHPCMCYDESQETCMKRRLFYNCPY